MTRIVRKVDIAGDTIAFWLDRSGFVVGWAEGLSEFTVEQEVAADGGWVADEMDAEDCGTTLAELRSQLTEEGEG